MSTPKYPDRIIGILAGMGPRSTGPFLGSILSYSELLYGASKDDDFPRLLIYSLPLAVGLDPTKRDHTLDELRKGTQTLLDAGAAFVAMPCNLAHAFHGELQAEMSKPLLNMVEIAVNSLPAESGSVAILAARSTNESAIYQNVARRQNIELTVTPASQAKVDELIAKVKLEGTTKESVWLFEELLSHLYEDGIRTVLLACTDLAELPTKANHRLQIIDAGETLAIAVIQRYISD